MVAGLVAGGFVWSSSHVGPLGIESGVLAGWAALMPDLDAAYEFVCHYAKYPFAAMFFPFGRLVTDRLHSWARFKFLHSLCGFAFFVLLAKAVSMLYIGVYAQIQLIVAIWIIFSLGRYLFHATWREFIRIQWGPVRLAYIAGVATAIWAVMYGRVPGFVMLPRHWFVVSVALGVGTSIVVELLSARGIPLLWPLRWQVRIPLIGETGGARESLAMKLFVLGWFIWWTNHYPKWHLFYLDLLILAGLLGSRGVKFVKSLF
jgi:hypothetical protein